MKLRELSERGQLLQVRCGDCNARAPVDPTRAAAMHGEDSELAALSGHVICPSCGSADTKVSVWSPPEGVSAA